MTLSESVVLSNGEQKQNIGLFYQELLRYKLATIQRTGWWLQCFGVFHLSNWLLSRFESANQHFISKALLEETSQIAEAWYKRVEFRLETWWYFHSPPLIRSPFSSDLLVFHISKCCQACCQVSMISSLYPYHKTRRSWTCWTPLEVFIWLYHHLSSLVHVRFRPLIHIFVGTISISCLNPWFLGCIWTHVWESLQSLVTTYIYIYINNM